MLPISKGSVRSLNVQLKGHPANSGYEGRAFTECPLSIGYFTSTFRRLFTDFTPLIPLIFATRRASVSLLFT